MVLTVDMVSTKIRLEEGLLISFKKLVLKHVSTYDVSYSSFLLYTSEILGKKGLSPPKNLHKMKRSKGGINN